MNANRAQQRIRRKKRVRRKVSGSEERPRLSVFRSAKNISAQIINDELGQTLVSVSTYTKDLKGNKDNGNIKGAKALGKMIAQKAKTQKIVQVVFDRGGYLYHGRVKALAEGAREEGLKF
jgi:large subunit ribosomal protein L18